MRVIQEDLHGVLLLEPAVHEDHRGFFMESYSVQTFESLGIRNHFVQDNHSLSVEQGVVRGLHYQLEPKAQTKLVRVVVGSIYDVVVDIRRGSPTFGQWKGYTLSATNYRQLYVPKGFAHGFCTLEPNTQVVYKVDEFYSREHDRGILWCDDAIGIDWPVVNAILSEKDQANPRLQDAEIFE